MIQTGWNSACQLTKLNASDHYLVSGAVGHPAPAKTLRVFWVTYPMPPQLSALVGRSLGIYSPFCRRRSAPHHRIRLNLVAQADIRWWRTFTTNWIGCSLLPLPHPSIHVFSDASGSFGCGAFATPMGWFQLQWPPSWDADDITVKELLPIVVAAAIWGQAWMGQLVLFHCDNMAVVEMVKHGTGRSAAITHLLRCLFFYRAHFGFQHSITHISGAANTAADALSRNNLSIFSSLFPQVPQCLIPKTVLDLLVSVRPDWGSHTWISTFRYSLKQVSQRPQPEPTARAAVVT